MSGSIASASFAASATSASYAVNATTASYAVSATTASYAVSATTASFANAFTVAGNLTAQTLVVQTITSSVDYVTGSTQFGSLLTNTHVFSGSITMNPGGLFVSSSGRVGIGTTNPQQILNVYSPASSDQAYLIMAQTSGAAALFTARTSVTSTYFGTENSSAGSTINDTLPNASFFANQSATALQLGTNNNIRLTITNSGSVGIGTTNPSSKLEVNVGLNSLKISGRDTYVDSTEDPTNANIYVTQAGVGDFSQLAGNLVLQARTQGTVYRDIIFAGGLSNGDALMTILGEGNVGIGTTNPGQLLEVVGGEIKAGRVDSSQEGGQVSFGRSTDNATAWYIDAYGNTASPQLRFVNVSNSVVVMTITGSNVGIGDANPSRRLVVNSGIDGISAGIAGSTYGIRFDNGGTFSSGMSTIHGVDSTLTGTYQPIMINGSDVRFGTSATERMRITSGGDIQLNSVGSLYSTTNIISIPNSATTIFTSTGYGGVWLVTYNVAGNPAQVGYAIVGNAFGSTLTVLASAAGSQTSLSVSGLNLQLSQSAGGSINTRVNVIKLNNTIG